MWTGEGPKEPTPPTVLEAKKVELTQLAINWFLSKASGQKILNALKLRLLKAINVWLDEEIAALEKESIQLAALPGHTDIGSDRMA
jgi:hypothetical protein